MVFGAIVVTALAHRRGLQPALVVVVLASAVSFVPGLPRFELDHRLILSVVLPPLLYSAALNFSFTSFRRNLRPILLLGVTMVLVSTLVTGVVAAWIVPGLTLVSALVLGAVVAPPDAVAALSVGRQLGLPNRLMAILTGESLVNDAAALTIFTLTVAAATGEQTLFGNPVLLFVYGAVVGSLVGLLVGLVVHWVRLRLQESALETAVGLLVPFAAYLLAEEVHASGVLAVVMAGFTLGAKDSAAGFATRLQARQVWMSLDSLLEAFVFAYMGLQCRFVFADLHVSGWFAVQALVVLVTVLAVRPVWVYLSYGRSVLIGRMLRRRRSMPWKHVAVISWSGMRGVVTLAAAAGVPPAVPGRDVIQALAFIVAVGTLLIQGPTLPWLIRKLAISNEADQLEEAEATHRAREVADTAARQAVVAIYQNPPPDVDPAVLARFKERYVAAINARRSADDEMEEIDAHAFRDTTKTFRRSVLAAQREALTSAEDLDEEAVRRELERLDYEEAAAAS
ncbi:sodium:proton antiporter [Actinocrispum sp. NPDC049592]|uniref:cation:proton antiporter n=1 Tax=Actinocrispum sp. NPDC049592 TaxID=3154835 RepID=UPI0034261571